MSLTFDTSYCAHIDTGGSLCPVRGRRMSGSDEGVKKRVERARSCLADLGVEGAIGTLYGGGGYIMERSDLRRVEAALLYACGIQLEPADIAA